MVLFGKPPSMYRPSQSQSVRASFTKPIIEPRYLHFDTAKWGNNPDF